MQLRKLHPVKLEIERLEFKPDFINQDHPADWLKMQRETYPALELRWLLAHADDGVIWGKLEDDGQFSLSTQYFPEISPPLRPATLQQLRLFGDRGELHLWRGAEKGFQARWLQDHAADLEETKYFEEAQILWGDRPGANEAHRGGYTLVAEGQGVRHAVPLNISSSRFLDNKNQSRRPLRLTLRHYLTHDEIGQAHICLSRLVTVKAV